MPTITFNTEVGTRFVIVQVSDNPQEYADIYESSEECLKDVIPDVLESLKNADLTQYQLDKIVSHYEIKFNMYSGNWGRNSFDKPLDLTRDQNLFSIRKDGEVLGYIEMKDGKIVTEGYIGEHTYNNFVELIKGLQGFGIAIDNFYT